jgi:hypothetical protein
MCTHTFASSYAIFAVKISKITVLPQLGNHIDITIMYPAACIFSISLMGDYGFFSHLRI